MAQETEEIAIRPIGSTPQYMESRGMERIYGPGMRHLGAKFAENLVGLHRWVEERRANEPTVQEELTAIRGTLKVFVSAFPYFREPPVEGFPDSFPYEPDPTLLRLVAELLDEVEPADEA